MAKKVKFPLTMANGTPVRTLDELKESFDLVSVLSYYDNRRLHEWLADRYYDEEVDKIKALDSSAADFKQSLCDIFGVSYSEHEVVGVKLSDISSKNERYERLKRFTAEDNILANVDSVAFTQEELADLLDEDVKVIYLCGEKFNIPGSKSGVTYIGVNNPKADAPAGFIEKNITFKNVDLGIDGIIQYAEVETDQAEAVKLWCMAAEQGSAQAQFKVGDCYEFGEGVEKNLDEAVKRYRKAAEQGHAMAQNRLGVKYWKGQGVEQSYEVANKWLLMSAGQGYHEAQRNIGKSYREGKGIEQNDDEAIKWFRKAMEQGNEDAKKQLMELDPKSFKLLDVILLAIGGKDNLYSMGNFGRSIEIQMSTGEFKILVENRHVVKEEIFNKIDASNFKVEIEYDYEDKADTMAKAVFGALKSMTSDYTSVKQIDRGKGIVYMQLPKICPDIEQDLAREEGLDYLFR